MTPSRNSTLSAFVAFVAAGGVAVLAAAVMQWETDEFGLILALAGLAVFFEFFDFAPFPNSRVSLSVAAIIAAAAVGGFTGVAVVGSASVAAQYTAHRKPFMKVAFNEGTLLLSGAAAVGAFEAFGTGYGSTAWPGVLAPALAAGAAFFAINSGLVAIAISIDKSANVFRVWSEAFAWLTPHYVLVGVIAVTMATAYDEWGLVGTGLPLVPLAMIWLIVRQGPLRPQTSDASA
ncbi:MAG: hypothetical protein IH957_01035 [Chloroflexi bacterium]|nr:hypothetical protein [Chloroflexota bacterium]